MKRIIWVFVMALVLGLVSYPVIGNAQMGSGYAPGYDRGYGPGYGMGPGMMGGMMGPGMMGPGMMGPGYGYQQPPQQQGQWNYCPWCGAPQGRGGYGPGYGMGHGMMGPGYGMGPGMMGQGYGMGPGMMGPGYGYGRGYGPQYERQEPLNEEQAKNQVENYLSASRNPNLKLGKIEDKGNYFEAEVVTKEGSLADKIAVDKDTGAMRSAY